MTPAAVDPEIMRNYTEVPNDPSTITLTRDDIISIMELWMEGGASQPISNIILIFLCDKYYPQYTIDELSSVASVFEFTLFPILN
jgi:hypothetical protein